MMRKYIEVENTLSLAMLEEILTNKNIQKILKDISIPLLEKTLGTMRKKLKDINKLSELPKEWQELITTLAAEHTAERRQYGALYPNMKSSQEIVSSIENIERFLSGLEEALLQIEKIKTVDEAAVVLKILLELGFTYYEAPKEFHGKDFERINLAICTTVEELDIRLFRSELGEPALFSRSFGIGTSEEDFGLQSRGEGRNAGKAAFGKVSMEDRLALLCQQYDENPLPKYAEKMHYYKIPLEKHKRESIDVYAKKWKTYFEKMAIDDPVKETTFPLIASVSRATTRMLVSLHDIGVFYNRDGKFDFDRLQIFTNCMMGFIVYAGHHSMIEVAEVSNRLCDLVAIDLLERKDPSLAINEKDLPYYCIGSYPTLFHKLYRDKVVDAKPRRHEAKEYDFKA